MRRYLLPLVVLLCACGALALPTIASAESPCTASAGPSATLVSAHATEPGASVSAQQALQAGERSPLATGHAAGRTPQVSWLPAGCWQVQYLPSAGRALVEVTVDPHTGHVVQAWTGAAAYYVAARGQAYILGAFSQPYFWLALTAIFFLAFFDFRRPLRLAHLDLLAVCGFALSEGLLDHMSHVASSVYLTAVLFSYLAVRLSWMGYHRRPPELYPSVPLPWLGVGLLLLVGARFGMQLALSESTDVGQASLVGASLLAHGQQLYGNSLWSVHTVNSGDTYGPFAYLAYVPFEWLFPTGRIVATGSAGSSLNLTAVAAASLTWDVLTLVGLAALGRKLGGRGNRGLSVVLPFAWAAFPYTSLALMLNTNDALIAVCIVWLLVFINRPVVRGALLACASATKFLPLVLIPLIARATGKERRLGLATFALALAAGFAVLSAPVILSGVAIFFKHSFTYQQGRPAGLTIWGHMPVGLVTPLRALLALVLFAGGTVLFWRPSPRSHQQLICFTGALLAAVQLLPTYWWFTYLPWFLPAVFAALLTTRAAGVDAPGGNAASVEPASVPAPRGLAQWLPLAATLVGGFAVLQVVRDSTFGFVDHLPAVGGALALAAVAGLVSWQGRDRLRARSWQLDLAAVLGLTLSGFALIVGVVFAVNGQDIGLLHNIAAHAVVGNFAHAHAALYLILLGAVLGPLSAALTITRVSRLGAGVESAEPTAPDRLAAA